jgi:hypothetical protein
VTVIKAKREFGYVCVCERERDRDRQTFRHSDRQTDSQSDKEIDRDTGICMQIHKRRVYKGRRT